MLRLKFCRFFRVVFRRVAAPYFCCVLSIAFFAALLNLILLRATALYFAPFCTPVFCRLFELTPIYAATNKNKALNVVACSALSCLFYNKTPAASQIVRRRGFLKHMQSI